MGATDFTIELQLRAFGAENTAPAISAGANYDWIYGNILYDRDRYNQGRAFGVSIAGGVLAFGVQNAAFQSDTLVGTTPVLDGAWHHVALQRRRSDGRMELWVDGQLDAAADGPNGDVSYPDDGQPGNYCGGPCVNSDPFIVLAAEKHDAGSAYPSYSGWLEELRLSTVLRYSSGFQVPSAPFVPDATTAALYHFDEQQGDLVGDDAGASGGPSDGRRHDGGAPAGPEWSSATPF